MDKIIPALLALVFVLGIIFACLWLLKKFNRGGFSQNGRNIKVIERYGLSAENSLMIVEVQSKLLLIGVTAHGMNVLTELSHDELITANSSENPSFLESFKSILKSKQDGKSPFTRDKNGDGESRYDANDSNDENN